LDKINFVTEVEEAVVPRENDDQSKVIILLS